MFLTIPWKEFIKPFFVTWLEGLQITSLVKKVLHAEAEYYENFLPENFAPLVVKINESYSHIISSANTFGKNFMPRVAALLDISQVSDIIKINSPDTFVRPIYAGNAFATVKSNDKKKCITIRPTSFDPAPTSGGSASIEKIDVVDIPNISKFIKREETKSERPELGTARIVISGGRGMQSGENFKLINAIADKLNAASYLFTSSKFHQRQQLFW